jgi:glycosyltransferase involved in cell wall biosynthesis
LYVDPLDVRALASAIESLASDDQRVATMIARGYVQAENFSVARHRAALLKAYARLQAEFG